MMISAVRSINFGIRGFFGISNFGFMGNTAASEDGVSCKVTGLMFS